MSNYINTVISICLAFILLVVAPLTFVSISNYDTGKRLIHNDTVTFLDTIQDKAYVTGQNAAASGGFYEEFYLRLSRLAL